MRIEHFLVFPFWGPVSLFNSKKGFRIWGVISLALLGIGLWFATHPRGELTGPSSWTLLIIAGVLYVFLGVVYFLKKT